MDVLPVKSPRHDVHGRHSALALVGIDVRVGEVLVPDVLGSLGGDIVLVQICKVLDELWVRQDPLGRPPIVVNHLASGSRVRRSV